MRPRLTSATLLAALALAPYTCAPAQLLTNVSFGSVLLSAKDRRVSSDAYSAFFVGFGLPALQSIGINVLGVESSVCRYKFIDTDSMALFNFAASFSVVGYSSFQVSSGDHVAQPITFTTLRPLRFTLYADNIGITRGNPVSGDLCEVTISERISATNNQIFSEYDTGTQILGPDYGLSTPVLSGLLPSNTTVTASVILATAGHSTSGFFPDSITGGMAYELIFTPAEISVPRPVAFVTPNEDGTHSLSIFGLTNQLYQVQTSTNLSGPWDPVTWLTNLHGSASYNYIPDPAQPVQFFRALVQ